MLCQHGNYHRGVLRSLALVNRRGIGQNKGVKFTETICDGMAIGAGGEFASFGGDVIDITDITVIDLLPRPVYATRNCLSSVEKG
jgi:hypothetical protein